MRIGVLLYISLIDSNIGKSLKTIARNTAPNFHINSQKFINYFGKATTGKVNYIQNYVTQDPSEPPILHKFRDEDKEKWLSGNIKH